MSNSNGFVSTLLQWFNGCLPNCDRAVELAERGEQKDLSVAEKTALKYNARLCPFCACSEVKVQTAIRKMEEAQTKRASQ